MKIVITVLGCLFVSACSTTTDFTRALDDPVKTSTQAATLADAADKDVLKATAVGWVDGKLPEMPELVCKPWAGPSAASNDLAVFGDALDTVKRVGEKPDDTSYAGYLRQFRENADNLVAAKAFEQIQQVARGKSVAAQNRCLALFNADVSARPPLKSKPAPKGAALPAIFGIVVALDGLVKTVLAQAENIQRQAAVRATIQNLIPQMSAAKKELAGAPTAAFGPLVQFPQSASPEALAMNESVLGAAITVHRWFVAQTIDAEWMELKACRDARGVACFGQRSIQATIDDLASNVDLYRSLARIDADKILKDLGSAIDGAQKSLDSRNPASWLDALVALSDALTSISDANATFKKAKE